MKRVNAIWNSPLYQEAAESISVMEKDRIFCGHGVQHCLDVARIAWIWNLERDAGFSREIVYAAALLHDMGRAAEYQQGIPHHEASAELASQLLPECGFSKEEQELILSAIRQHRSADGRQEGLAALLYQADKASRCCFACEARKACKWSREKMNLEMDY